MTTIAENIQTLRSIKSDIKQAITNKGGSVGNDFKTYAQAITNLPSGGGGGNEDLINLIERDITTINIPDGTTKIGNQAFQNCSALTNVITPNSVTSIGTNAFYGCHALTKITIPDSITSIGSQAFYSCSALTEITIPDGVTIIDSYVLYGCSALTEITIHDGVTSIGSYAFKKCPSLTSITIMAAIPPTLRTGVFDDTNNCPIYVPAESVDAYKTATNWSKYASRIQAIPTV